MAQIRRIPKGPTLTRSAPSRRRRTPKRPPVETAQDREVIEMTEQFIQENERVLRELGNY